MIGAYHDTKYRSHVHPHWSVLDEIKDAFLLQTSGCLIDKDGSPSKGELSPVGFEETRLITT